MKQCRMCSQRLTRPGRLCRECERELSRARYVGLSAGEPPLVAALPETLPTAGNEWLAHVRAPASVVAIAFAFGVAATVTLQVIEHSEAAVAHDSVMLGSHAASVHQVSIVSPGAASAHAASEPVPVDASATVDVTSVPVSAKPAKRAAAAMRVASPMQTADSTHALVKAPAVADSAPAPAAAHVDAGAALDDALGRCSDEPFLARPDCEQRARARYCDAMSSLPRCMPATRDYGQ